MFIALLSPAALMAFLASSSASQKAPAFFFDGGNLEENHCRSVVRICPPCDRHPAPVRTCVSTHRDRPGKEPGPRDQNFPGLQPANRRELPRKREEWLETNYTAPGALAWLHGLYHDSDG